MLNVKKNLRRGIFFISDVGVKTWVPFKYENLSVFCYGCGTIGYNLQECVSVSPTLNDSSKKEFPFYLALKAESNMVGRESLHLGVSNRRQIKQCSYEGNKESKEDVVFDSTLVSTALVPVEVEFQKSRDGTR